MHKTSTPTFDSSTNLNCRHHGGSSASVDLTALSRPTTLTQQLRVTNTLQVDGNIRMNGGLLDGNGAIGSIGQVLSSTGTKQSGSICHLVLKALKVL